jgi:excisionase family DNA binding protein
LPTCYDFAVVKYLTTAEVAKRLGVTRARVLALIYEGRLKAEKVGVQLLIAPADLAKLKILKTGRPKKKPAS